MTSRARSDTDLPSDEHSEFDLSPFGDMRSEYIRDPVNRGQSTNAVPSTELLDLYTLLRFYYLYCRICEKCTYELLTLSM